MDDRKDVVSFHVSNAIYVFTSLKRGRDFIPLAVGNIVPILLMTYLAKGLVCLIAE